MAASNRSDRSPGHDTDLRHTLANVAPGTPLREGLERILRGNTGALIIVGHDHAIESMCTGGFVLDVEFSATRLRELAKMDGAIILAADGTAALPFNTEGMARGWIGGDGVPHIALYSSDRLDPPVAPSAP